MSEFDAYAWHEAMDRAHVLADTFATHIAEHPVVESTPELHKLCDDALRAMFLLYQRIGQLAPHMKATK